jgi:hypothetical protein
MADSNEHGGYDEQFNDRLFTTALRQQQQERPYKWPISVSQQRRYVDYSIAPSGNVPDHSMSDYICSRPFQRKPLPR